MLSPENRARLTRQAGIRNLDVDTYLEQLLTQDAEAIAVEKTRLEVIKLLHKHLDCLEIDDNSADRSTVQLLLKEESVHKGEYAWQVWVYPSREPRRWEYLYEEMAIIAENIAEETGHNLTIRCDDPLVDV
ncbi:hypothetical protein [Armatimonas sp.]|uniref:hypothetical protein n=1 Tax=Armatimonas sp. TaxID=1872638 RepID=UPI0037536A0D